ncbi:MAG TPA: hypothetical protein DCX07_11410 [Phycisphaerales bacterium]|nr:hypothetical protein [Phycisphaerales bacterium]
MIRSRPCVPFLYFSYPKILLIALGFALLLPAGVRAELDPADPTAVDLPEPEAAKQLPSGAWFDNWKKFKAEMAKMTGTEVCLCADNATQVILNGPGEGHSRNLFWWNMTVTQKLWTDAKLVARVRGSSDTRNDPPHGVYPLIRPTLNMDWRWAETEWLYLANLYIEQKLLDGKLLLVVGKINSPLLFDTNEVAGWDFLSHSLARNHAFPHKYHTIGAVVRYDVMDWLYVQAGLIDAQGVRSETGTNTAFHGNAWFQSMYEVGFKTAIAGRKGNYRFNLWHDPTPRNTYEGDAVKRDTVGFGISFDQMITDKLGMFLRYGFNERDTRTFSHCWSAGATYTGLLPGREQDVLGVGFVQGVTGDDYRRSTHAQSSESLFETYYKIRVTEWLSILPDLQVLLNPGTRDEDVSVVAGLRVKIDL